GTPDLDTWNLHCVVDREDDSRVIFDVNRWYNILTWVVQDEDDGTPTKELIWHFDYGTSGATENRLTAVHLPSACSDYDESSPYGVTLNSSSGVVYEIDYDYATDTYDGYPERIRIKEGTGGTADTLIAYDRSVTERPDLPTTITHYESGSEADGRSTTLTYTFYDSDKYQPKQLDITYPSVSSAKNGPAASAVEKRFFDKRTGDLRWTLNGEGYVNFIAYDDDKGMRDLTIQDANTSTLMTVIDDNWDGVTHGGLGADDTVPFSRTGSGTALDIDASKEIDSLGRVRKSTDAEGMITYWVYKDDETRTYPAWDSTNSDCDLPINVTLTDEDGRAEQLIRLGTDFSPNTTGGAPDGTESYANTDMVSWTVNSYDISGMLEHTDRYHDIPSSGAGTRYTNFYRTAREYDSMGRLEYTIQDVSDESTHDREQVSRSEYDFVGRMIKRSEAVSDENHDITAGKPTLTTTAEYFYDDPDSDSTPEQGEGDGNLNWVREYYGSSSYNDTEYRYDWRNRRQLIIPPLAPYTLIKHDNLDRATATGTYSATTNLDPGDDPATTENTARLDLSKTYFDEWGRVYKSERFDDPSDATPADTLTTNTYHDRRGLVWATDAPNTGIRFTSYDGASRRTQTSVGTQFDSNKYTGNAPDYPDDNEGLVRLTEYTLDEVGNVQKVITKSLNHDDTNGMDTDGTDFIRTYVYNWHDSAHRVTDTANYGTNDSNGWEDNSTAPTYGASAPSRSDTVLVTTYSYDTAGRRNKVTDPEEIVTESVFDDLNRRIAQIEDSGASTLNRKTLYQYNGQGSLSRIIHDPDA
ncbi:MAG: RHS repeat domain-containing protein, partial [Planctomycetota bacterium]